jgi:hypothetical protein
MSNRNKVGHPDFSALILASSIVLIPGSNCFASDHDPSTWKHIEKFGNSKIIQKDRAKYFNHAKFWEEEGILRWAMNKANCQRNINEGQEFLRLNGLSKKR